MDVCVHVCTCVCPGRGASVTVTPQLFLPPSVRGLFAGDAGADILGQSRLRRPAGDGHAARSSRGPARICGFQGS